MIADETYEKLKRVKEAKKMSFTELLESFLKKDPNKNRYQELLALKGTWKDTPADREMGEWIRKQWKNWGKGSV